MSHSGGSGSGKAGSPSQLPARTDTETTTAATPTGAGSSNETAPNSSSNDTNPSSEQAWTTVPPWRTPARRGRGGSAAGGAYNNPANTSVRGGEGRNDGTSGRAPTRPTTTTPGTTAATSSSSWAKGPPGRTQAASTSSRSSTSLNPTAGVYQHVPKTPTAPGPAAIPPKAPSQGSTTKSPSKNWTGLNEFVTGRARAPASPIQAVTTGERSGEARTPIPAAAEAPPTVAKNTSTAGAAKKDTVIEKAAVGEPTSGKTKAATAGRPGTRGVQMNKDTESSENPNRSTNPLTAYESLMPRTRYNQSGREANVNINSYRVTTFPDKNVYQYDILIGSGTEKRGLIRSVWESQAVNSKIREYFIFDGNRIGWSMHLFDKELVFEVDLDEERKLPVKEGRPPNRHRVMIRKTNIVNLSSLKFYLEKRASFDNSVLEAINFLDHLLRETPSKVNIAMKRSYFSRNKVGTDGGRGGGREELGGGVEAMKGVYQSIRMAEGGKLVINVDVSNSTFWKDSALHILAKEITGAKNVEYIPGMLKPVPGGGPTGAMRESHLFSALRRMCKNEIKILHRNCRESVAKKTFRIERIRQENAREPIVEIIDKETGSKQIFSVEKYFAKAHNVHLNFPDLPLVEVGKRGALYPMEVCHMVYGQRYPYRLDPEQTTKMISFAISKPEIRKKDIMERVGRLDWEHDPFLSNYGLKIEPKMLKTKARVLNSPEVQFNKASAAARPGTSGQWNLLGKKFLQGNTVPLKAWGIFVFGTNQIQDIAEGKMFIKSFMRVYRQHGGTIANDPVILGGNRDCADAVTTLFNEIGKTHGRYPQLMFFVLRGLNNQIYSRIKKSADCRYGVVSQCVQYSHVRKNQDQYISNVCMKVNAKLGGTTSQVRSAIFSANKQLPPMIIGADVSHAAPGSSEASFAAITVSMDHICARYAAAVEANGFRAEMITAKNIEKMLTPLIEHWKEKIGNGRIPDQVYYFRDGVSEGQYHAVLNTEVEAMKQLFSKLGREKINKPKFTVVIAEKRHHIRFFPESGSDDRNGNPRPGTLVERDVTHPFQYDFYLCSHKAIMGTARPTHYHILKDECEHRGDSFQNMIYEHCYQYMRSTTSVALFPAVYYAHLASKRGRSHVGHLQKPIEQQQQHKAMPAVAKPDAELLPLEEMRNDGGIQTSMWYI